MIPGLKFGQDYYDDLLAKYTHKKELFLKGLDDLHIVHNDPERRIMSCWTFPNSAMTAI